MMDIKDFIQEKMSECEKRSMNLEEKIQSYTERMKNADDEQYWKICN